MIGHERARGAIPKRHGSLWRNQTSNLTAVNDPVWSEAAGQLAPHWRPFLAPGMMLAQPGACR